MPRIGLLEFSYAFSHLDQKIPYKISLKKNDSRQISKNRLYTHLHIYVCAGGLDNWSPVKTFRASVATLLLDDGLTISSEGAQNKV